MTSRRSESLRPCRPMLTGLADYARIQKPAKKTATLHAIINDINLGIYILSIRERSRGNYRAGAALSLFGMGFVTAASWLGGHLVYGHKVGVDHSDVDGPEEWTPTIASQDLPVGKPTRVEVDGNEVCSSERRAASTPSQHAATTPAGRSRRVMSRAARFDAHGTIRSSICATAGSSTAPHRARSPSMRSASAMRSSKCA
jgi:hypothetical protein